MFCITIHHDPCRVFGHGVIDDIRDRVARAFCSGPQSTAALKHFEIKEIMPKGRRRRSAWFKKYGQHFDEVLNAIVIETVASDQRGFTTVVVEQTKSIEGIDLFSTNQGAETPFRRRLIAALVEKVRVKEEDISFASAGCPGPKRPRERRPYRPSNNQSRLVYTAPAAAK